MALAAVKALELDLPGDDHEPAVEARVAAFQADYHNKRKHQDAHGGRGRGDGRGRRGRGHRGGGGHRRGRGCGESRGRGRGRGGGRTQGTQNPLCQQGNCCYQRK